MTRDWTAARRHIEGKCCIVCGRTPCDPAHIWPRSQGGDESEANIAALCTWSLPGSCHTAFDHGEIDLLPHLTHVQVVRVVELAAKSTQYRSNGLEAARMRLLPSAYDRQTKVGVA